MKHLKTFESWEESSTLRDMDDKTGMLSGGEFNPSKELAKTNDLWVMDGILIKADGPGFNYTTIDGKSISMREFYEKVVPDWVKLHYNKDLRFDGEDFKKIQSHYYDKVEEFLSEKGYTDIILKAIYYLLGHNEDVQDSRDTEFFFAYDMRNENGEDCFAVFNFNHYKWEAANISKAKMIDISDLNGTNSKKLNDRTNINNPVGCFHGTGRYRDFKVERPYNGLSEYFGTGAGNIVIFEY